MWVGTTFLFFFLGIFWGERSGTDPAFLERGGHGTMGPVLLHKRVGRLTDFMHSDMKMCVNISFLQNVSLIMQDLNWAS